VGVDEIHLGAPEVASERPYEIGIQRPPDSELGCGQGAPRELVGHPTRLEEPG
jgi:hypothetical protein